MLLCCCSGEESLLLLCCCFGVESCWNRLLLCCCFGDESWGDERVRGGLGSGDTAHPLEHVPPTLGLDMLEFERFGWFRALLWWWTGELEWFGWFRGVDGGWCNRASRNAHVLLLLLHMLHIGWGGFGWRRCCRRLGGFGCRCSLLREGINMYVLGGNVRSRLWRKLARGTRVEHRLLRFRFGWRRCLCGLVERARGTRLERLGFRQVPQRGCRQLNRGRPQLNRGRLRLWCGVRLQILDPLLHRIVLCRDRGLGLTLLYLECSIEFL